MSILQHTFNFVNTKNENCKNFKIDTKEEYFLVGCVWLQRLPVFLISKDSVRKEIKTEYGYVITSLNQRHKDVLDAIAVCALKKYENTRIVYGESSVLVRLGYLFKVNDVLKFLGLSNKHLWLDDMLNEIKNCEIRLGYKFNKKEVTIDFKIVSGIHSYISNKSKFVLITFTNEFVDLILRNYTIYQNREFTKGVVDLSHNFLKSVVRFCVTNNEVHICFTKLLDAVGIKNCSRALVSKYRKLLLTHKNYLKKFNINVVNKNNDILIEYKKLDSTQLLYPSVSG